ncbi:transposase [Streptomyces sp. NPDC051001]|uniref:transposase n=1 Tax=Streptomyces sp. NPDC051001 TaxID=3155795 RepID=UPI003443BFD7
MGGHPAVAARADLAPGANADGPRATATASCWTRTPPGRGRNLLAGNARGLPRLGPRLRLPSPLAEQGLTAEFHDRLRGKVREREGREAGPTARIDAQSVRAAATVPTASRGYDGGKKVPGRKRHIVTDTLGLLLVVAVTAPNIGDRDAAADLLRRLHRLHRDIALGRRRPHQRSRRLVPGQTRSDLGDRQAHRRHDRVRGAAGAVGAERTFAWLMNSRRLARDYETLPATSEAMIRWSMVTRMSRRLGRARTAGRH